MKAVRIGLYVLFAFSVLAHGVVEVWSESVLEIGASVLLVSWGVLAYWNPEIAIRWNSLNWPFLGVIGIGAMQLALHWSADPFLTRIELLRFAAYFIVFWLLVAGMIASPAAYDPARHPKAAKARRDLVLKDMLQQGYLTEQEYKDQKKRLLEISSGHRPLA